MQSSLSSKYHTSRSKMPAKSNICHFNVEKMSLGEIRLDRQEITFLPTFSTFLYASGPLARVVRVVIKVLFAENLRLATAC